MEILFLTDNFPPESNAPASRTFEHVRHWVKHGNRVTVITCAPNFPEGKIYSGYRNGWYSVEDMEGIKVVRVKTYITANEGFFRRTLDYISFLPAAFIAGLIQRRPHIIIGTSPQFFTVCSAWLLSFFRRCPFVFELRDLWPASIKAVGAMHDSLLIRMLEYVEMFLYKRAKLIITVTTSFRKELIRRGIEQDKIKVVLNGVDLDLFHPREKDIEFIDKYKLQDKFVIGYIGTQGMAHGLDKVLKSAAILKDETDICFLLIGSGAESDNLKSLAKNLKLDNVCFIDRQTKELMPNMWSLCDVSLISLKNESVFSTVIPSKIFESMGMGLPMILFMPKGEATGIIEQVNIGITVPPGDSRKLVEAILELYNNQQLRYEMARNSRQTANNYSRSVQAKLMLDYLHEAY